jgi:hypothetical protein
VVVVSRNPNLAWAIGPADHDLVEVRPQHFGDWLSEHGGEPLDLVVIDVGHSEQSLEILTRMRSMAQLAPALLVASDDGGWSEPQLTALPGAEILPLPISTPAIQAAIGRLLAHKEVDEPTLAPPTGSETMPVRAVAGDGSPGRSDDVGDSGDAAHSGHATETADTATTTQHPRPNDAPALRRGSRTSRVVKEALAGTSFAGQVAQVAQVAHTTPPAPTITPQRQARDLLPPGPAIVPDKPARSMDSANALARSLALRVDELYGVPETAAVIVSDALERVEADAAALLLPDGSRWRVAAGSGLAGMERRFELEEDSWVIANVARAAKGVLVEDSDVARGPFRHAPLASRRHLLAAPIRLVEGVLLVARDEDPAFTEASLAELARMGDEAGLLLAAALDVRDLARRLQAFVDQD